MCAFSTGPVGYNIFTSITMIDIYKKKNQGG